MASPFALLTPAEMAAADRAAIARGVSGHYLMEAAGRAIARAIMARFRPCRTLVLTGPGNNGGDGYVAARLLEQAGWPVAIAALAPPRPGSDAAQAAALWRGPIRPFSAEEAVRAELVIDAVFGAGLDRPLPESVARTLAAVRAPLIAVDVPSGLDGATGKVRGFAPQASLTVTFFRRKPGHLLMPGRMLCGRVVCADIGLPDTVLDNDVTPQCFENAPGLWHLPDLCPNTHKYRRGIVSILAGAEMTGAARLVAAGARRAGAGLVRLLAPDAASAAVFRTGEPGLIVGVGTLAAWLAQARQEVWVIGPGLAPTESALVACATVVAAGRAVVADAGLLTAAAGMPERLRGVAVITPHEGEFASLFGPAEPDRLTAVRAAAKRLGAVVVLKGPDTAIAAPDGRVAINAHAPPWLASAGTGDVLAGLIAALLAAGMEPFAAAGAAVWLHGEAAYRCGPGLIAEDLPSALPAAFARAAAAGAGRMMSGTLGQAAEKDSGSGFAPQGR